MRAPQLAIGQSDDYEEAEFFDSEEVDDMIVHSIPRRCEACGLLASVKDLFAAAVEHFIDKDMPQFQHQTRNVTCACTGPSHPLTAWFWRHPENDE